MVGRGAISTCLTAVALVKIPSSWGTRLETTFMALAVGIVGTVALSLLMALVWHAYGQRNSPLRGATLIPSGWSAIVDGGAVGPGDPVNFSQTKEGTWIPPEFHIVKQGPGAITDDLHNTVTGRVWYRRGRSGNTFIG